MDTDQPTVSNLLKDRVQDFLVDRLITFLGLLSHDVSIIVRPAPAWRLRQVHVVSGVEYAGTIPLSTGQKPAQRGTARKDDKKRVAVV